MAEGHSGGGGGPLSDLYWLLGFLVVLFFIWLANDGPARSLNEKPLTGLDITSQRGTSELSALREGQMSPDERRTIRWGSEDIAWELKDLEEEVAKVRLQGEPSPFEGLVRITSWSNGQADIAQEEHLVIEADFGNDIDIPLTGWRLESAVTGNYGTIGYSSELPITGKINTQNPLLLPPGGQAIIVTGSSPIGTSFRVNICSAYLEQFQNFKPEISNYCPTPAEEFEDFFDEDSITKLDRNESDYDLCRDFINTLPQCTLYRKDLRDVSPRLPSVCQSFVRTELSYQGCIENHRYEPDFYKDEWRVYLGNRGELWRDRREIIRLLDAQDRTVDIFSY